MFYRMRGKTIETTEYFFGCGQESASLLVITFTDGTMAIIKAYEVTDEENRYAAITTNLG